MSYYEHEGRVGFFSRSPTVTTATGQDGNLQDLLRLSNEEPLLPPLSHRTGPWVYPEGCVPLLRLFGSPGQVGLGDGVGVGQGSIDPGPLREEVAGTRFRTRPISVPSHRVPTSRPLP